MVPSGPLGLHILSNVRGTGRVWELVRGLLQDPRLDRAAEMVRNTPTFVFKVELQDSWTEAKWAEEGGRSRAGSQGGLEYQED